MILCSLPAYVACSCGTNRPTIYSRGYQAAGLVHLSAAGTRACYLTSITLQGETPEHGGTGKVKIKEWKSRVFGHSDLGKNNHTLLRSIVFVWWPKIKRETA
ncbi:hypothetical protein J6590_041944 [Homalodisca vitripennis]|nr:hypothetical protein J6590_041944 [Homalodisca vitripennis]